MSIARDLVDRRRLMATASYVAGAVAAAAAGIPVLGFFFAPFFEKKLEVWRTVGKLAEFTVGTTVKVEFQDSSPLIWAGVVAETAAWLRRTGAEDFTAFAVNCSHLGCPVRWQPEAGLFLCPCHGGVYYADGAVAGGPPPKPLFRYDVRLQNGEVQLKTRPLPID